MAANLLAPAIAALLIPEISLTADDTIGFARDIRPVLADNCFFCHGPDVQEASLRLDVADMAYDSGAVVPRDPNASELIRRITSSDPDVRMPPPDANRDLSSEEIASLRTWIQEGGIYERHWAFQSVPPIQVPDVYDPTNWSRNAVDQFVLKRLQDESLSPSPGAGRERLLRRVSVDLTGLPATINEIDAFLTDDSEEAWKTVVERLLRSPAFGEQMAQQWVDVARYADTFGYDNDNENHLWPWRDWIIRAFNGNLPYSDFIRWQIAGDLLPSPTQDQLVATAFNRLHRQNAEGGVLPEEFVVEYVVDRTQTFGTAFLGLTIECARCHDHKFDPISQRDFYGLFALFGNIDELGTYAEKTSAIPTPNTFLYTGDQHHQHESLREKILQAEVSLSKQKADAQQRFPAWRKAVDLRTVSAPEPLVHLAFDSRENLPGSADLVDGKIGRSIRFTGDEGVRLQNTGAFERTDVFTIAMWLRPTELGQRMVVCHNSKPIWEVGQRGLEVTLDSDSHIEFSLCHFWPGNALRVTTELCVPNHTWTHVGITYDGSSQAAGIRIYLNGAQVPVEVVRDNLYDTSQLPVGRRAPLEIGARPADLGFRNGEVDDFRLYHTCLTRLELKHVLGEAPDTSGDDELLAYYTARVDKECAGARRKLKEARVAENEFVATLRSIMIMREQPGPATARVLNRGAYDQPGDEVLAGVPAAFLDPGAPPPRNRLELVDWMLRREHPLVARVAVNRLWKIFFGEGLVSTMEDFGSQGAQPINPELMDYLAAHFMENGWDVKAFCRLIVTSATYCQSAQLPAEIIERDPENRLLARGPRHRLSAEQIRDAALTASGLLVRTIGGPSVRPSQPAGLWKEVGPKTFEADQGDNQYRRSLYTFWKRTVPPPNMMTFDAVSREVCVARRESTVTPNQALVLLNDPQFVEAARVLATDVLNQNVPTESAIIEAFRRLTGRHPRDKEIQELMHAHAGQIRIYEADSDAAVRFVSIGETPRDESLAPQDLAGMTAVVQLMMGFFEFQVKL